MLTVLVAGMITRAEAGDLVLHAGDPAAASAALGVVYPNADSESYDLRTVSEWLAGKPITLTAGTFEVCAKAPARPWKDALAAAQKPIDEDLDFSAAKPLLDEARAAMVCSTEPLDAPAAAKVEYLRGVAAHFAKDGPTAQAAFVSALTIDPNLAWDPSFPPSARTRFDDARKDVPATKTSLAVIPRTALVRIDGRTVEPVAGKVEVADGTHIVQIGEQNPVTLRVTFAGVGAASLAVPAAVPAEATAWVADPVLSGDLARLASLYTPGVPLLVIAGADVYTGGNNSLTFSRGVPPEKKAGVAAFALLGSGGALFVSGAVVSVAALGIGNAAIDDGDAAATYDDWVVAESKYKGARGLLLTGWGITAAGVALAGVGGALFASDTTVGPMFLPGGGGLVVRVGGAR